MDDLTRNVLASMGLAESEEPVEEFMPRLVTATVKAASSDVAELATEAVGSLPATELVLPRSEWLSSRPWHVGDRFQVLQLGNSAKPLASMNHPDVIEALFEAVSPEVRSGQVRIMGLARIPGVRAKVAVAATTPATGEEAVEPIAACVGRAANRVKYVSAALGGEQVDIVAWHPEQDGFLRNALQPAAVTSVTIEGDKAVAFVPAHQMSAAVGSAGLNSQLAGQLVGLTVTIEVG